MTPLKFELVSVHIMHRLENQISLELLKLENVAVSLFEVAGQALLYNIGFTCR